MLVRYNETRRIPGKISFIYFSMKALICFEFLKAFPRKLLRVKLELLKEFSKS